MSGQVRPQSHLFRLCSGHHCSLIFLRMWKKEEFFEGQPRKRKGSKSYFPTSVFVTSLVQIEEKEKRGHLHLRQNGPVSSERPSTCASCPVFDAHLTPLPPGLGGIICLDTVMGCGLLFHSLTIRNPHSQLPRGVGRYLIHMISYYTLSG